jgi:uncharacterized membrane protein
MAKLHFPEIRHGQPVAQDVVETFEQQYTTGQKAADWVASLVGSWRFIIVQSGILLIWLILNVTGWVFQWDPYPFILMNLVLSTQAAFTAPIIMMSQGRQAVRDRLESHHDYEVNLKAEQEIRMILEQLEAQNRAIIRIHDMLEEIKNAQNS